MRLNESDILFIFKDVNVSLPNCTISQYLEKNPVAMDIFKYVTNMFALYATDLDRWCTGSGPEPVTINSLTRILMIYFGEITKPNVDCSRACVIEAIMALIKKNILHTTNQVGHCQLYDHIIKQANAPFSQFLKVNTMAFVNIVNDGRNNKWEKSDNQMRDESIGNATIEAMDLVESISVESDSMKNKTSESIPLVTLTLNIPDGVPLDLTGMVKLMKDLEQLTIMNPKVVVVIGKGGDEST